jgi:HEAT repeat protein
MGLRSSLDIDSALKIIVNGSETQRIRLQKSLQAVDTATRTELRNRILERLKGPYSAANVSQDVNSAKAKARSWMLGILGRIVDDDAAARTYLREQTKEANEPNPWSRYWALESLVVMNDPELLKIAEEIERTESEAMPLSKRIASAILAKAGNKPSLQLLLAELKSEITPDQDGAAEGKVRHWQTLRALRVIPIEEAVPSLCDIVMEFTFSDATYDAIIALSVIPNTWPEAQEAASALMAFVKECRKHIWWAGMKTKAIAALGNLQSPDAREVLLEELSDGDAAVVYEAATALEKVVGVKKATAEIVERASQVADIAIEQYATGLRWMNRDQVAEELEHIMLYGSIAAQDAARALLSEIGGRAAIEKLRNRTETMRQHLEALEKTEAGIKEMFDQSIDEAKRSYWMTTGMNIAVFVIGLVFIGICISFILRDKSQLTSIVTGSGGVLAIIYNLFFSNPRKQIRESSEHLMSLKVIFLGYLRQLHQTDKAYARRYLEDAPILPDEVEKYGQIISDTMKKALRQIRYQSAKIGAPNDDADQEEQPNENGKPAPTGQNQEAGK